MNITPRKLVAALAALAFALPAAAQDFPSKQPIRLVVGFATGGGTDAIARAMNTRMGEILKQSVVVENRGGAGGTLAADLVAKAPADGYTVLFTLNNHSINQALYPKLPYDTERDFRAVSYIGSLKPAFRPDGQITAGNACPLNDGAAAVMVMSDTKAKALGIKPLARVVSSGVSALNPEIMGLGPIEASRQALKRAGMTIDQIDLVEINEAFAAQVIPSAKHLGISWDKLNIHGGAIALGHPFGMTGARIMTTLIHGLQETNKTFGLETMCVGGGQGLAMIVERLS